MAAYSDPPRRVSPSLFPEPSPAQTQALLDAIPDLLLRLDRSGRYLDFREPQGRSPAVPPETVIGKHISETMPAEIVPGAECVIARALESGGVEVLEYDMPHFDELRSFEARVVASGPDEVLVIVRDVTERKRAEAVLRRSKEELEAIVAQRTAELAHINEELRAQMREREQTERTLSETRDQLAYSEKLAVLGSLLAGVAHEINTPIAAIASASDTLERGIARVRGALERSAPECLSRDKDIVAGLRTVDATSGLLRTGIERVRGIVDRLRTFARLDGVGLERVDIHRRIDDTLLLIGHELKRGIEVVRRFGELPLVACYPGRLDQAFLNLVNNARQAILADGRITITTTLSEGQIRIAVEDDGVGISAEDMPRLFEPGFTTKPPGQGTGLGLAICRKIMDEHLGHIEVESAEGRGARFTIVFPADLERRVVEQRSPPASG